MKWVSDVLIVEIKRVPRVNQYSKVKFENQERSIIHTNLNVFSDNTT
jgi:hypothetical protein